MQCIYPRLKGITTCYYHLFKFTTHGFKNRRVPSWFGWVASDLDIHESSRRPLWRTCPSHIVIGPDLIGPFSKPSPTKIFCHLHQSLSNPHLWNHLPLPPGKKETKIEKEKEKKNVSPQVTTRIQTPTSNRIHSLEFDPCTEWEKSKKGTERERWN